MVTRPSSKLAPWIIAPALLGLVLLAASYKLTLGLAVPKWDADRFYAPLQMLVADHARAGKLLLWNPWVDGGSPDYADPQVPSFSPLAIGIGFVTGGTALAFPIYWLVVWFLGGLGVVLLGRHLGAPAWGCAVVAGGFMFSGFYTGHAEHTSTLYTISSLGFLIWRLDVALSRHTLHAAVEAGVIWGLSALGGYPGWVFLNACFATLWAAGRLWFPSIAHSNHNAGTTRRLHRPLTTRFTVISVTALAVVGLVVLSPTYAAFFLEAPGYTDRSAPLSRDVAVYSNALHPGALATFASPYLSILKQYNPELWEYTNISSVGLYLGPIVPVLALVSLVTGRRDRWRWWIAALGVGFLLAALGQSLPIRGWLYDLLLPARYFRHSSFMRIYPMFAIAVLALLGSRDLALANEDVRIQILRRFALTAGVVSALAVAAFYGVIRNVENPGEHALVAQFHLWAAWLGICAIALIASRTPANIHMRTLQGVLITLAVADSFVAVQLSQPTMWYEGHHLKESWDRLTREHNPSFDLSSRGLQRDQQAPAWSNVDAVPHNKNLPLKIPTLHNYTGFTNRFHLDLVQRPALSAMASAADRIWCSSRVVAVPPSDAAYAAFVARSSSLPNGVLLVHPRDQLTGNALVTPDDVLAAIAELPAAISASVRLKAYRPDLLSFEASCPENGWLLVTDRWSRGWHATVNGKPTDVWGGNFVFRAVPVEAGTSDVQFTYKPAGFPLLVILSWSVVFATLAWSVYGGIRRSAQ